MNEGASVRLDFLGGRTANDRSLVDFADDYHHPEERFVFAIGGMNVQIVCVFPTRVSGILKVSRCIEPENPVVDPEKPRIDARERPGD